MVCGWCVRRGFALAREVRARRTTFGTKDPGWVGKTEERREIIREMWFVFHVFCHRSIFTSRRSQCHYSKNVKTEKSNGKTGKVTWKSQICHGLQAAAALGPKSVRPSGQKVEGENFFFLSFFFIGRTDGFHGLFIITVRSSRHHCN